MSQQQLQWLTTDQIRKRQRCRREAVLAAMDSGALPFEQRGRARYARLVDVERWEASRVAGKPTTRVLIHRDFIKYA